MTRTSVALGVLVVAVVLVAIVLRRHHANEDAPAARADTPTVHTAAPPPELPPPSPVAPSADPAEPPSPPPPAAIGSDQAQAKLADEALEPVRDAFLADLTAQAKAHDLVVRLGIDRRGTVLLVNANAGCTDQVLHALHDLVDRERANTAGLKQLACGSGAPLDL